MTTIFANGRLVRMPPGYHFLPTDEELVVQYLKRKVNCAPLPADIIDDVDVYKADPWDLLGDKQEMYYFCPKEEEYRFVTPDTSGSGYGYWMVADLDMPVVTTRSPQCPLCPQNPQAVVGIKKTLVFYYGKSPQGIRTDWIMHEYRLPSLVPWFLSGKVTPPNNLCQGNWVLCRIFLKNRCEQGIDIGTIFDPGHPNYKPPEKCSEATGPQVVLREFMGNGRSDLSVALMSPSPVTSVITDITSVSESDDEEEDDEESDGSSTPFVTPRKRKSCP